MTKTCTKCNVEKILEEFDIKKTGKHGRRAQCKECRHKDHVLHKEERNAKRLAVHNEKMKDPEYAAKYREKSHEWYTNNKDYRMEYDKTHRERTNLNRRKNYPKNREKLIAYQKKLREEHGDRINARRRELRQANLAERQAREREYSKERRKTDLQYRIVGNLRNRIRLSLENKSECTKDLLGCSLAEFVSHLQDQFTSQMSWDNYGPYWEIDHIRPCASFDLTDPAQQRECFHYTNCRPLTVPDNRRKGSSWEGTNIEEASNPSQIPCIPTTT